MINEKEIIEFAKYASFHLADIDDDDMTRAEKYMAKRLVELGFLERLQYQRTGAEEKSWVYSVKDPD